MLWYISKPDASALTPYRITLANIFLDNWDNASADTAGAIEIRLPDHRSESWALFGQNCCFLQSKTVHGFELFLGTLCQKCTNNEHNLAERKNLDLRKSLSVWAFKRFEHFLVKSGQK